MPESSNAEDSPVAAVEVLEELTEQEAAERHRLELRVERAFYEAALALQELHSRKLYRSTHNKFHDYCLERFGFSHRNADYLIRAADVIDNLKTGTNGSTFLPSSERQVRPLTTLEPDEQREVWYMAVREAGGIPSGRIVKNIVERLKEKYHTEANDKHNVGDVFWVTGLLGSERKYNNCWAIAIAVNDFTIVVDIHEGTLAVRPDNLKPIDEPDVRRQLPTILKRIRRLRDCGLLDRCAYTVLESLGRQTYLTEMEDKVLSFLEQQYKISK